MHAVKEFKPANVNGYIKISGYIETKGCIFVSRLVINQVIFRQKDTQDG